MIRRILTSLGLTLLLAIPAANAGILEDLLAVPAIQSLLGRQPDLQQTVKRCADAKYRQTNPAVCQQAEQADRLARMPAELRAVLAVPSSAASIRELCLAAQAGPQRNSYLCAELSKADLTFKALSDQQRKAISAAEQQKKDADALANRDQIN